MRPKKRTHVRKSTRASKNTRARKSARITKSVRTVTVMRTVKAVRTKKAVPAVQAHPPVHTHAAALTEQAKQPSSSIGTWALVFCVVAVLTGVLLVGRPAVENAGETTEGATPNQPVEVVAPRTRSIEAARSTPPAPIPPARALVTPVTIPTSTLNTSIAATTEIPHATQPAASTSVVDTSLVTITGCLETNDESFRLKDTTGFDAPKSRSWKTGFLTKRSASIAVVDASGVSLPTHVGQRVALTGVLVDRDMQVRYLRRVAASCDQ